MRPINSGMDKPVPQPSRNRTFFPGSAAFRFVSLRTKFVVFFSLILILTCSALSWYFVETRREAMTDQLQQVGTILLTNTVRNDHFRFGGLVGEDPVILHQFVEGLMAIDDMAYVVITGPDGRVLDQESKRTRIPADNAQQAKEQPLYPDKQIVKALLHATEDGTQITRLGDQGLFAGKEQGTTSEWLLPFLVWHETIYDFAMPVLRKQDTNSPLPHFSVEREERVNPSSSSQNTQVYGVVQIGITDAQAKRELLVIIRNVLILTVLLIGAGILGAHVLTLRITTPLRSLAGAARQLAEGNHAPVPLVARTRDEIGQLTNMFNEMMRSLHERNQAITANLDTIKRQVSQLTTLHQASAAIASTLSMNQLLDSVLQLLVENLGFSRMVLILRHAERNVAYVAQITGVSPVIAEAARHLEVPIQDDGGITADLLIRGKPLLIHDIEAVTERLHPPVLELLRRSGVRSFVCVPLQSHNQTLGYLAGDRDSQPCTDEDLHILLTIASHVAAAIDNARAYSYLAELTQDLERRIEARTQELSLANKQLQEHDRQRTTFLSVVSHELRTPMTAIRSFAENMLDGVTGPLNEQQTTYLTRIEHNVARLARIIRQLLDWSRLEKDPLHLEPVCIREITAVATDSLQMVATEKQVTLNIEPIETLPLIKGDRDKLEQILWNLIGNAIKFTPPGGRVTVEFRPAPTGFVQTCVADTGCGIEPDQLSKIFNEFSKVPSAMPASQGAQLGLFITRSLVLRHRGDIWVESTPGAGTRFYFSLPVAVPHNGADQPI
jgi:signal transduction histidine kinase/HAMP domain-containing protein